MTDVADKLREARALIKRGWTQGSYAKNAWGRAIGYEEDKATCWCSVGALLRVTRDSDIIRLAYTTLERAAGTTNVARWNDAPKRTPAEVLAAFDKAIELAEASQ